MFQDLDLQEQKDVCVDELIVTVMIDFDDVCPLILVSCLPRFTELELSFDLVPPS
jgi:hypothetical protein